MAGPRPSVERPLLYEEVNIRGTITLLEAGAALRCAGLRARLDLLGLRPFAHTVERRPAGQPAALALRRDQEGRRGAGIHPALPARHADADRPLLHRLRAARAPRYDAAHVRRRDGQWQADHALHGGVGVYRDWTYIADIVAGVVAALDPDRPFEIFNLGDSSPVQLRDFVTLLEGIVGYRAQIEARPLPPARPAGDLRRYREGPPGLLGYQPRTSPGRGPGALLGVVSAGSSAAQGMSRRLKEDDGEPEQT